MAMLFGKKYTKDELLQRVGSMSQLAGVRKMTLSDGNEKGVETYIFKTGSGFNFTVLADRGLDISAADWNGRSLAWHSSTGDVAPQFFEPEGLRWLRSFYGGLVCTCGMTTAGAPSVDEGEELGLHGRYSHTPAREVCYGANWVDDDYEIWVEGKIRQTRVFGENLLLTRRVSSKLGDDRLFIQDTVENQAYKTSPFMLLYHINGGFPAVDTDSVLLSPTVGTTPRDADAEIEKELYYKFPAPTPGFKERVYYHDVASDPEGVVYTALANKKMGFGFYVKYNKNELPVFTEWKMNNQGTYVVGMEPANCHVEGRAKERQRGTLQFIEPGEIRQINLEIGVLTSNDAIASLEDTIKEILRFGKPL